MDLETYQIRCRATDFTKKNAVNAVEQDVVLTLLGLAGEVGSLSTAYKKFMRDGEKYRFHLQGIKEEIGDVLWYLAILAEKFQLNLNEIAEFNLKKVGERWINGGSGRDEFIQLDMDFPKSEQLPRKFEIAFQEELVDGRKIIKLYRDGEKLGDDLTDNSFYEDGYRFHDVFHIAFAACLGWSPVLRKLLGKKRRSNPAYDENEDGGRAAVVEEGISAYVFEYADKHKFFDGVSRIDFEVLKTLRAMCERFEVRVRTLNDWEHAIFQGYDAFRKIRERNGGIVAADLDARTLTFSEKRS